MTQGVEAQGVGRRKRHQVVPRVLVFPRDGNAILLLRGAPDKPIWPGLLNGIGGHVEAGEDPLAAACRELDEECGIQIAPGLLSLRAVISIDVGPDNPPVLLFVFVATVRRGAVRGSVEGSAEWHDVRMLDGMPLVEDLPWLLDTVLRSDSADSATFVTGPR